MGVQNICDPCAKHLCAPVLKALPSSPPLKISINPPKVLPGMPKKKKFLGLLMKLPPYKPVVDLSLENPDPSLMSSSNKENKVVLNPYAPGAKVQQQIPQNLITEKISLDAMRHDSPTNVTGNPSNMKTSFYRGFGRRVRAQPQMSKPVWPNPNPYGFGTGIFAKANVALQEMNQKSIVKTESRTSTPHPPLSNKMQSLLGASGYQYSPVKSEFQMKSEFQPYETKPPTPKNVPRPPRLERDSDEERRFLESTNGFLFPPKGYKPVAVDHRRKYPKDPEWKPGM